jgi:hypothetical protein
MPGSLRLPRALGHRQRHGSSLTRRKQPQSIETQPQAYKCQGTKTQNKEGNKTLVYLIRIIELDPYIISNKSQRLIYAC